jgi:hypothetical protein
MGGIVKATDNSVITQPKLGRQELINIPPEHYDRMLSEFTKECRVYTIRHSPF